MDFKQMQSRSQDSDDAALDTLYTDFFHQLSEFMQERQDANANEEEPEWSSRFGNQTSAYLRMVIEEHKAKTKDLMVQKTDENMETICHLRDQLIAEE